MPGRGMMGGGMMGDMMGRGGMMDMMGRNCPMMGGNSATFTEGRVAFLGAELAITDAQKTVWETYAAALKKNLQGMQAMRQTMMKVMEAKTPVERLDAQIATMDGRLTTLKDVKPAPARALYGVERRAEDEGRSDHDRHELHDVAHREPRPSRGSCA